MSETIDARQGFKVLDDRLDNFDEDLKGRALNVKNFGAKGDGIQDDTLFIQNALNSLTTGQELLFPKGVYMVSSLTIPNTLNIGLLGTLDSVIKKISDSNNNYLIASSNYLNNFTSVGNPLRITNLKLDGNNIANDVVILQVWGSSIDGCEIKNGLRYGLTFTGNTLDGSVISSTAVNNRVNKCSIHDNGVTNIQIADTSRNKVSDMFITDNYIYTSGTGIYLQTAAGTLLSGNHFYGHSTQDVSVSISSFGLQFVNNYFEGSTGATKVVLNISDFVANTACIFSSNTVSGQVRLYSGNAGCQFVSTGNNYRTTNGSIRTNWNTNVVASSVGDRFESDRPLLAVDGTWGTNASSTSKFLAMGSTTSFYGDNRKLDGVITASNTYSSIVYGAAAPTTGTFSLGSICWNTTPVASGKMGWVCITGGTPGTWKAFGAIDA